MTSATSDLLDGLGTLLDVAGLATYTPGGSYTTSDTGFYIALMPPGSEGTPPGTDRAVVAAVYASTDNATQALTRLRVQLRFRGTADPLDVTGLADAAFELLHGQTGLTFGTCHVIQILRLSQGPVSQDERERWERRDNYVIDVNPPATQFRNQ